jgi:hypothetical protein
MMRKVIKMLSKVTGHKDDQLWKFIIILVDRISLRPLYNYLTWGSKAGGLAVFKG